jgi:maltose O-acetyltransferase
MNEKEKMLAGKLYIHTDALLTSERDQASDLMHKYNKLSEAQQEERKEMLSALLGKVGSNVVIKPPFMVDYGYNIEIGNNFFANYGFTILDCNKVTIGDNVLIGPNVQVYSATHPTDHKVRQQHLEFAERITIGNDVWIGGGVIICKGVTIGDNTTIGAGSVITKNIPANVIAAGNPCKVIKYLDAPKKAEGPIDFVGLGHVNIVVENIDEGMAFYEKLFGATPVQMFRNFNNAGFAKAAGFLENPENVTLSIAFMALPNVNLTLELMEYHVPKTKTALQQNLLVSDIAGVRHVALKVKDVRKAFEHVIGVEGTRPIHPSPAYMPYKIDAITADAITLFDENIDIEKAKATIVRTIGDTHYCYFIDKYGVQWELEQGHTDIGD